MRVKIGHPRYSAVATISQNAPIHIAELVVSELGKGFRNVRSLVWMTCLSCI